MIYLESPWNDPYLNLALEEFLFKEFAEEVFMLWRNDSSVIIGKNQNALAEINAEYVRKKGIAVVRRLTGGGAVFHDLGNLNFTFIVDGENWFSDFRRFTAPIIDLLQEYGVNAEFGGRNDLLIDGRKFSGNAQAVHRGRLLHHGTILFHTDFGGLTDALCVDAEKIRGKAVSSVRSRVTNIWEHKRIEVSEFMERLATGKPYTLSQEEENRVRRLADEKYRTWEWNYGLSPDYGFHSKKRFAGGGIEAFIDVRAGVMADVRLFGDFFGIRDVSEIEGALRGVKHRPEDIKAVLGSVSLNEYFLNISEEEVLSCLWV